MEHAETAKTILGELAKRQADVYRASWARSLRILSICLTDLGQYDEALAKAQDAEVIYRELAQGKPEGYGASWATSLHTLSVCLDYLGQYEESLAKAQDAAAIYYKLAEREPETYRDSWASYLARVSNSLRDLGRYNEALAVAKQGEAIIRRLAELQPDAYREAWAYSFTSLANHLRDLEHFDEALVAAEQAEVLYYQLADKQPDAYRPTWALSLGNLAEVAVRGGLPGRALPAAEQAVEVLEALAVYPNDDRDHLGFCLRVLAEALLQTGDAHRALEQAQRGEKIWTTVFAERPSYACEQYGKSLPVLARARLAVEGKAAAVDTLVNGIESILPYFQQRPRALVGVMDVLVRTLRDIDPTACAERVPGELIEQLDARSHDTPRRQAS